MSASVSQTPVEIKDGSPPTATAVAKTSPSPLTAAQLRAIMPKAPLTFLGPLNFAMLKWKINTPRRMAAFLAQIAVESSELRHTHEAYSTKKNFKLPGVKRVAFTASSQEDYFKHWYGKRAGNDSDEDGFTYRGRGAIQITGRSTYADIGKGINQPLLDHPELVETDVTVDAQAACYYFAVYKKGLLAMADSLNPAKSHSISLVNRHITHKVNGGYNGLNERLRYYHKALKALSSIPGKLHTHTH